MKDLKELIKESGLTISEVSKKSGISQSYLKKLMNGTAKSPKVKHSYYLSKALNVDPVTIMYAILKSANVEIHYKD